MVTFKGIVLEIIEREARKALETELGDDVLLDFGAVEITHKGNESMCFAVECKVLNGHTHYRVIGFISQFGRVVCTRWRESTWPVAEARNFKGV